MMFALDTSSQGPFLGTQSIGQGYSAYKADLCSTVLLELSSHLAIRAGDSTGATRVGIIHTEYINIINVGNFKLSQGQRWFMKIDH